VSVSVDFIPPPQPARRKIPHMIKKPDKREIKGVFIFLRIKLPKLNVFANDKTQKY
jgi:hypothetical protein